MQTLRDKLGAICEAYYALPGAKTVPTSYTLAQQRSRDRQLVRAICEHVGCDWPTSRNSLGFKLLAHLGWQHGINLGPQSPITAGVCAKLFGVARHKHAASEQWQFLLVCMAGDGQPLCEVTSYCPQGQGVRKGYVLRD